MLIYPITPVPKPRMTRADKWKKRPRVMRYRAFADEVRLRKVQCPPGCHVHFVLPMPLSWSAKKKEQKNATPHRDKPDVDNLLKALLDALYDDDSAFWDVRVTKWWGYEGAIGIDGMHATEYPLT